MSMNPEQDEFQQLRRLLVLKRYEQPPPGYFNDFSRQVIDRIIAGEQLHQDSLFERLGWEAPWLQRFLGLFDAKPILAGAFGVAVCSVLVAGFIYSEQAPAPEFATMPAQAEQTGLARLAGRPVGPLLQPAAANSTLENLTPPAGGSLFQQARALQSGRGALVPASFSQTVGN